MMTHDNSRPAFGGAEHLKLFAQPLNSGWRGTPIGAGRAGGRQVDYNATGSIRHGGLAAATVVESKGETAIASADGKIQVPRTTWSLGATWSSMAMSCASSTKA